MILAAAFLLAAVVIVSLLVVIVCGVGGMATLGSRTRTLRSS
jgi:hypothetical protein